MLLTCGVGSWLGSIPAKVAIAGLSPDSKTCCSLAFQTIGRHRAADGLLAPPRVRWRRYREDG